MSDKQSRLSKVINTFIKRIRYIFDDQLWFSIKIVTKNYTQQYETKEKLSDFRRRIKKFKKD